MNLEFESIVRQKFTVPEDTRLGWHFLPSDRRLRYDDNRMVVVGETLSIENSEDPEVCVYGMHASHGIIDAFNYAPMEAGFVCLVWVRGDIEDDEDNDKFCGRERHCLAMLPYTTFDTHYHLYVASCTQAGEVYGRAAELAGNEQKSRMNEVYEATPNYYNPVAPKAREAAVKLLFRRHHAAMDKAEDKYTADTEEAKLRLEWSMLKAMEGSNE